MFYHQPGLGHMSAIAKSLSLEASLSNRVGLLPPLLSNPDHNPGAKRRLSWDHYFKFDDLPIIDSGFSSRNDIRSLLCSNQSTILYGEPALGSLKGSQDTVIARWFPRPSIYGQWLSLNAADPLLKSHDFGGRFSTIVQKTAAHVLSEIGLPAGVMHIRRGDMACAKTEPLVVLQYLESKGVGRSDIIYLMTNETDQSYIRALKDAFHGLVWERDLDYVRTSKQLKSDNYLLFRVGKYIQSRYDRLGLGVLRYPDPESWALRRMPFQKRLWGKIAFHSSAVNLEWLSKEVRCVFQQDSQIS
jgi:hypothetical protein